MCIAIVKPKGVALPSIDTLKECWRRNPDGAGFCYNDGKKVVIHKGYMTFEAFYKALQMSMKLNNLEQKDVGIHFRISTSGGVKPQNTHPFAVSSRMKDLTKSFTKCRDAFLHNGIISGYGSKDYSDTMEYITHVISKIKGLDYSNELINNLAAEKHSRFAVVTRNGYILGGDWIKDGGIYYSNDSYKPFEWPKTTQGTTWDSTKWDERDDVCDWCERPYKRKQMKYIYSSDIKDWELLCPECKAVYDFYIKKYNEGKLAEIDTYNK